MIYRNDSAPYAPAADRYDAMDYVRCGQGDMAGQEWCQLTWISGSQAPTNSRHQIGGVQIYIHNQAIRGLKNRRLHFDGQNVVVKS